jgi:D-3-phosphoglycerate dehydrogenase
MQLFHLLVTDDIDPEGVELLRADDQFVINEQPTRPWKDLVDEIGQYDAFIGRSATRLPAELLKHASKLRVIGRAGVGIDNIDIAAATELGIAVINAPAGNTVAVAELFFGMLIAQVRHLARAFESMRAGRWDRGSLTGSELRGRTLGIVGLGRIGSEVAVRAHAFGMKLVGYDPYIPDERFELLRVERATSLDQLLGRVDVLTVHTPITDETRGLIGAAELAELKPGAIVANLARGGIIEEAALVAALKSGRLGGALIDVYGQEPAVADHPLRAIDDALLTPHLGASTAEGQRNVAVDVCIAVRDALKSGELSGAVNVDGTFGASWTEYRDAILLARRAAAVARALLADRQARAVDHVTLRVGRDLADGVGMLVAAAAMGVLEGVIEGERLNLVNAKARAEARGIALAAMTAVGPDPVHGVQVTVRSGGREVCVGGVASPGGTPRLTRIDSFSVDVAPRRTLIVLGNADVPGVIGRVGTLLGEAGVNIAEYHQARLTQGGEALAAITVDGPPDARLRQRLLALPDVRSATVVNFGDTEHGREPAWS